MRKYAANADSSVRVEYGVEVVEGLRAFPETVAFAAPFETLNDQLDASYQARNASRKPWRKARAALRIRELGLETLIRQYSRAVEIADGGRKGPLYAEMFPEGVTPVLAPFGTQQIKPAQELADRLHHSRQTGADPLRQEWTERLRSGIESFSASVAGYEGARRAYYEAFQAELALRDEHERAVERLMGQVRTAFPKDRTRQDVIFPRPAVSPQEETEEETVSE